MHGTTFVDFDICQQMTPLPMLYPMTLTYFLSSTIWYVEYISETQMVQKWEMILNIRYFNDVFVTQMKMITKRFLQICFHLYGTRRRVALALLRIGMVTARITDLVIFPVSWE